MPLDWLFMKDESTIRWLSHAFATNFDDFCLKENLVPIISQETGGTAPFKYHDTVSGYGFIHHFHQSIDNGGYEAVYSTFKRRIDRMFKAFSPQHSVLLILATPFSFDLHLAEELLQTIRSRFPETTVDLHVIQFSVAFDDSRILADRITTGFSFITERYARAYNNYDNDHTSYAWSFLDSIKLIGRPFVKPKGFAMIRFKIWKSLSKWLRNHGYGCLGVRFHG